MYYKKSIPLLVICIYLLTIQIVFADQEKHLSQNIQELAHKLSFPLQGEVIGIDDETIYIDLCRKDGAVERNQFEIMRLGEPLTDSEGNIKGHQKKKVGQAEILRVYETDSECSSQLKVTDKMDEIKKGDRVYQSKQVTNVAVFEFSFGKNMFNRLTRDIQMMLRMHLIQQGMVVVEIERVSELIDNLLNKQGSRDKGGYIDLDTAAELGKEIGVKGVIVGSIADMEDSILIQANLVDVETKSFITVAAVSVKKTLYIRKLTGNLFINGEFTENWTKGWDSIDEEGSNGRMYQLRG